jgi:mono/diheme cytochrome c family protein
MSAIAHALALLIVFVTVTSATSQENLDRDKSGAKLFAATCQECHKSARGLAKGRISFTLSYYLRQHYTSSAASASVLTAYLQSLDTPPAKGKAKAKTNTAKSQPKDKTTTGTVKSSNDGAPRPPAAVPKR